MILLGLTTVLSAIDAAIQTKIFESGMTTLIISNEETNDSMKLVKSLEKSVLLIKGASETIQHEAKKQKEGFLGLFF